MDKDLCKQAYNDSTEAVARLASFCTADYIKQLGHGYYESRAAALAARDTMLLCISLRRLAELTATQGHLQKEVVHAFVPKMLGKRLEVVDAGVSYSAWDVIGNVIHAKLLLIIKDDAELKRWLSMTMDYESIFEALTNRQQIEPLFFIKSDKAAKGFRSLHLIKAAVRYLEAVEDVLSDNKIYVGDEFD
jgi:hypothetical protein